MPEGDDDVRSFMTLKACWNSSVWSMLLKLEHWSSFWVRSNCPSQIATTGGNRERSMVTSPLRSGMSAMDVP